MTLKIDSLFQILALDLLKARVCVMPVETRKTFIGTVLVGLIEKTTDAKVFIITIIFMSSLYLCIVIHITQ